MTGIYGFSFTLPQMVEVVRLAVLRERGQPWPILPWEMEDVALIICEAANLPMLDVLSALQRLAEWKAKNEP